MIGEHFRDAIYAEILDCHAVVRDRRLRVGPALSKADVLGTGPDAEPCRYVLAMLDRQSEQALVELDRAFAVGNRERHVTERAHTDGLRVDCAASLR